MPEILITNDDGIDNPGLAVMHEILSEIGDVVAVAPQTNQSGVGRLLSYGSSNGDLNEYKKYQVDYTEHELGYAVEGTPSDCVIAGLHAIDIEPDIVVSGCNPGINCGEVMAFRSGTVAAAAEAAHLGTPSIASSVKKPSNEPTKKDFYRSVEITKELIQFSLNTDLWTGIDYLNLNVPQSTSDEMNIEVTMPVPFYEMDANRDEGRFTIQNTRYQKLMSSDSESADGTDLGAIQRNNVSITAHCLSNGACNPDRLSQFEFRAELES